MIFLLFLILLKPPSNVGASECFNCSTTNMKNDSDTNNCLKPNQVNTPFITCEDFCVEKVELIGGNQSHYKLTRGCSNKQVPDLTIAEEPCSMNNISKTHVCNSTLCNDQLRIDFNCYSCAYSTNNQTITSNGKKTRYLSDRTCLKPGDLTPMVKCHKRCVEYTRNQTKEDGEIVGIVLRDCLEHLDPRMSFGSKREHNFTCYTDLCNKRHFHIGRRVIDSTNSSVPFFADKSLLAFAVPFIVYFN